MIPEAVTLVGTASGRSAVAHLDSDNGSLYFRQEGLDRSVRGNGVTTGEGSVSLIHGCVNVGEVFKLHCRVNLRLEGAMGSLSLTMAARCPIVAKPVTAEKLAWVQCPAHNLKATNAAALPSAKPALRSLRATRLFSAIMTRVASVMKGFLAGGLGGP